MSITHQNFIFSVFYFVTKWAFDCENVTNPLLKYARILAHVTFSQLKAHLVTNSQFHFLTDSESPDLLLCAGEMLEVIMQLTI